MRWFAMALLAVSVAACGADTPSDPTPVTVVGTWTLETVNGTRLPFVLDQRGNDKVELLSAALDVMASGTFSSTSTERSTIAGVTQNQSYVDPGHFTLNGSVATFTFDLDASVSRGTIAADAMTFDANGLVVVYRRNK
jgi:hypothetical protein